MAAKEVPQPVPPGVAFFTNPAGLSDARLKELTDRAPEDAHAQLKLVLNDLIATLADQRGKDGRNVGVDTPQVLWLWLNANRGQDR